MTTTFPQLTAISAGDYRIRVMMADGDPEEHLLVSAFAAHRAPQLEFTFARDGADLMMQLAFVEDIRDLPDVIVLAYDMPRYNGLQALREIQAHPVLWQVPVVVVSRQLDRDLEVRCYQAGARWVQQRPAERDDMAEFLERVEEFAATRSIDVSVFAHSLSTEIEMLFD